MKHLPKSQHASEVVMDGQTMCAKVVPFNKEHEEGIELFVPIDDT